MNTDQQTLRSRPRVSRACERCRVKKAKIRRKTESASTNQRYNSLLIQHQEALTAGLVELYRRLAGGQKWDGALVEEVNGNPSVHGILERLGVLDRDEDAIPSNFDSSSTHTKSEPVSPVSLAKSVPPAIAPKPKGQVRATTHRDPVCHTHGTAVLEQRIVVGQSPKSATATTMSRTSTACGPQSSPLDGNEVPEYMTFFAQHPSSPRTPPSNTRSSLNRLSMSSISWDSPMDEFGDDLFGTPTLTPGAEVQPAQQRPGHQIEPVPQAQPLGQTPPQVHQNPYALAPSFTSPHLSGTEAFSNECFFDATLGAGVSMYGWDNGLVGPGGIEYVPWDTGVYV
ncbi:hypothetical protein AYO20_09703 [Fonsecaea nubica]|uniref:Uncharacterized protein n=1 Tax=Fonsecaea nubica TaxID=856822 RepID=A0A178CCE8_9EURO|nr:hypothetical protein AYO20_09703 [Fonsecaea nubica]OAL27630.1 hypothetical protein AYO20_09703 [Fonsecaea nubica]